MTRRWMWCTCSNTCLSPWDPEVLSGWVPDVALIQTLRDLHAEALQKLGKQYGIPPVTHPYAGWRAWQSNCRVRGRQSQRYGDHGHGATQWASNAWLWAVSQSVCWISLIATFWHSNLTDSARACRLNWNVLSWVMNDVTRIRVEGGSYAIDHERPQDPAAHGKEYGTEKGKSVFYAARNKGRITGVDEPRKPAARKPSSPRA